MTKKPRPFRNGMPIRKRGARCGWGPIPADFRRGPWPTRPTASDDISERHRHRYEFNNAYLAHLEEKGLVISGASPSGDLVEIVEINDHPWFLGCQFHPEFKSRPMNPHPLFRAFIEAALDRDPVRQTVRLIAGLRPLQRHRPGKGPGSPRRGTRSSRRSFPPTDRTGPGWSSRSR